MKNEVVSLKGDRRWQGIPAIERAANGRLWCAFYSGGEKEPHPNNFVLITSRNSDGKPWSEPKIIVAGEGETRVYDPALWHDPEGKLWLFYNRANTREKEFSVCAVTAEDSPSDAPEWSGQRIVELGVPFAFRLNKPIVISSGEWVLPVTWAETAPEGWFPESSQLQGVAISADKGVSWKLYGGVKAPPWALENMVVELSGGRLWMLIRAGGGMLWESFSSDAGRTWSEGIPGGIVNPATRFFISRISSGRLLLINTFDRKERKGLKASISAADDETCFAGGIELDPRDNVSYPDAVEDGEGNIYAVHDCDRYGTGEIILNAFTEKEVIEKSENTAMTRL